MKKLIIALTLTTLITGCAGKATTTPDEEITILCSINDGIMTLKRNGIITMPHGTEILAEYKANGLQHRWDWDLQENGYYNQAFVVGLDGLGMYYNFPLGSDGGELGKPISTAQCSDKRTVDRKAYLEWRKRMGNAIQEAGKHFQNMGTTSPY